MSVTFAQGNVFDVLISRVEPKMGAFLPSSASMAVCITSKYHLKMTQRQQEKYVDFSSGYYIRHFPKSSSYLLTLDKPETKTTGALL